MIRAEIRAQPDLHERLDKTFGISVNFEDQSSNN